MSEGNDNSLVFNILTGTNTLTAQLEKILMLSDKIKANLDIKGTEQNVTMSQLGSIKSYLNQVAELRHLEAAIGKTVGKPVANFGEIQAVLAELKALTKQLGVQANLAKQSVNEVQGKAFAGKITLKEANVSPEHRKAAIQGLNQLQRTTKLSDDQNKLLTQLNQAHADHLRQVKAANQRAKENEKADLDTRLKLKLQAKRGSLTSSHIIQAKTPEELRAIQLGLRDRLHRTDLTAAQRKETLALEERVGRRLAPKSKTPFEDKNTGRFTKLEDFANLTKAESKVGVSLLARRIATLKKEGASYAQVVKVEELHQAARDLHAKNFRPASAFQLREAENLRVAKLPENQARQDLSSLKTWGEVAQQLRMSNIRAKELTEGPAKQAEILYANALKAHGLTLEREPKQRQAIVEKAQKIVEANTRKEADAVANQRMAEAQERAKIREAEAKAAQKVQQLADRASRKVLERQRQLDDESPSSVLRRAKQHGVNAEISKTDSGYAVKVRQAQEAGALTVVRQERKQKNDRELEHLSLTRYQRMSDLAGLDAAELKQAKRVLNYRNGMATAGGRVEKLNIEMLQELSKQQAALAKKTRADEKLAIHNQRMATDRVYKAAQDLKDFQAGQRANTVNERVNQMATASDRLRVKAQNEREYYQDMHRGTYGSASAIASLRPDQFQDAKKSLNFQRNVDPDVANRNNAKEMLALLKLREQEEARIARAAAAAGQHQIQQMTLIKKLAESHYFTKESLNGLNRQELELAKQVLKYRQSIAQTPQARLHDTQTLNHANQLSRLDPQNQADHRASSRERVLGDGGASLMAIQAGLMLNYKILGGFQSLFGSAISSAMELDSAFKQLQAISAATNYEMVGLKLNLIDVAQASKFSAAEVGQTAVLLAQAGFTVSEISSSMRGVIMLAQATGTELGKAVDVVTSVLSVFNKSAATTEQVANQLTEALNRSKLDIQKVALGIQYAGNVSSDAGVTFEELTSALGAMANAGIRSGSTLGTGFRQMLLDLERPSTKLKDRLNALGISLNQIDFRANGLAGVLKNLRAAGFTTADAMATFEVRSAAAFSALSGNLEDFDALQESLLDTNAAFTANYVQMEGLVVQLDHLKSNLGIVMAEGLRPMTALTRDVAKGLAHMMENSEEGSTALMIMGTTLASLSAAVAVAWLAKMTAGLVAMTFAARTAQGALLGLSKSGWVGVLVGIGFAVAAYRAHNNELDRMTTALDTATGKNNEAKEVYNATKDSVSNLDEAIKKVTDRYGVLVSSQVETTATGKALEAQFRELGLTFDDLSTLKAPALIAKLKELREVQFGKQKEDAYTLERTSLEELDQKVATAKKYASSLETQGQAIFSETLSRPYIGPAELQRNEKLRQPYNEANAIREASPQVMKLLQGLLAESVTALKTGKVKPNSEYSPADIIHQIQRLLDTNPFDRGVEKTVKASIEKAKTAFQHATVLSTEAETRAKIKKRTDTTVLDVASMQRAYENPNSLLNLTETRGIEFNKARAEADLKYGNLDERKVYIGELARKELTFLKSNIAVYDKLLADLPKEGGTEQQQVNRRAWNTQKDKILEDRKKYDDAIAEADAVLAEGNKKYLEMATSTARAGVASRRAEYEEILKVYQDSDILSQETERGDLLDAAFRELLAAEEVLANLTTKGGDAALAEKAQEQRAKMAAFARIRKEQLDKITQYGKEDKQELTSYRRELELKYYVEEQDSWMDELKAKRSSLDNDSKAQLAALEAKASRTLSDGEMFGSVNKDLRSRAATVANRTGISQEYAQFGTGTGDFFARAAAKQRMAGVKAKFHQNRLANNLVDLDPLNLRLAKEKEDVAKFEAERKAAEDKLTQLKEDQAKGLFDRTETAEQIKLAQEDYNSVDKVLQAHKRSLEEMAKAKEQMKAETEESMNYLKETVFDPLEELTKSLRAGQEAMSAGLSSFIGDWASGMIQNTEDVKDAFEAMGKSILQSMLKVLTDRTATMFTDMLLGKADGSTGLGLIGSLGSAFFSNASSAAAGAAGIGNGAISLGMSSGGFVNGNAIPHFANGGATAGTDIGRDSLPAYLRPDEYVLRPSATAALGKPFLDRLNATTTGSLKQLEGKAQAPQVSVVQAPPTNVYVISPDQKQQMGPQDVVVSIEDNISRGGSIKRLIKSVISGEV